MKLSMSARTQAVVLLALVGTSGALAGVVGDRLLHERTAPAAGALPPVGGPAVAGPWRWEPRPDARYADRLARQLDLSTEQEAAITGIVAEEQVRVNELTRELQPRFRAIAEETRGRIESVLTPEQRERLRTLRAERTRVMAATREGARMGPQYNVPPALRDSVMRERRDSGMRERRDSVVQRNLQMRARRDSVMRQLRRLPPEVRDSIIMELRGTLPPSERRDGPLRERQRMLERMDSSARARGAAPPPPDTSGG
jgi:Spy/CpxP family protein refolding chaperone